MKTAEYTEFVYKKHIFDDPEPSSDPVPGSDDVGTDEEDDGIIRTLDIEPAISYDHIDRLTRGINSLIDALGVVNLKPMAEGSVIKVYKYVKKNNPEQVPEGAKINRTKYERKLSASYELTIQKHIKDTTGEAIQRSGRQRAINDTDVLLMKEVQKGIKDDFVTSVSSGGVLVTGTVTNLQSALAQLWGETTTYYEDIDHNPIFFIHPLDVADYLATTQVTVQNAFGFQYIKDFMALGTAFIDSHVPKKTVLSTAAENINFAYIPANSEVAQTFALTYDETGFVGMKHALSDDTFSISTLIINGTKFYCEDTTGIFKAELPA